MTTNTPNTTRGVIYFNHGRKHLVRLVVSLWSLRKHYTGPITILDTGETSLIDRMFPDDHDDRLRVDVLKIPIKKRRRHSAYCAKASLWRHSPYDTTLYLDADTAVVADPSQLFEWAAEPAQPGIVVTRFAWWSTHESDHGDLVGSRVRKWRAKQVKGHVDGAQGRTQIKYLVDAALDYPWPAVNTGVVAWRKGAPILPAWQVVTEAGWRTPFTDELAMQLLLTEFPHTLTDDRYNASPIYTRTPAEKVVVWHFHGNKQCRSEALPIWWPLYQECLAENVAGIRGWTPAGDKRLTAWLKKLLTTIRERQEKKEAA